MKKLVLVFPRQLYRSTVAGGLQAFHHPLELSDVLGQAKTIVAQAYLHGRTGAQTQITVKAYQSARPRQDGRCEDTGGTLGTNQSVTTLGSTSWVLSGDFHGRVELVLEMDSGDSNVQEADLEVRTTLILGE